MKTRRRELQRSEAGLILWGMKGRRQPPWAGDVGSELAQGSWNFMLTMSSVPVSLSTIGVSSGARAIHTG